MKRLLCALGCALLAVQIAAAVEVRLRDGSVLTAESVRVTGSYVMLVLADGRMVAYDVADVDLDSLPSDDDPSAADAAGSDRDETLGSGRSLKSPSAVDQGPKAGLVITDREVRHVRGSGVRGDDELVESPPGSEVSDEVPDGYQEGGSVLVNNLEVTALGEGRWQVSGEIVNRHREPVINVSVRLESPPVPGLEPWRTQIKLSSLLEVNAKAVFNHEFEAPKPDGRTHPDVRATAIWTQRGGATDGPGTKVAAPVPPAPSNLGSRVNILPTPTPIQ